LVSAFEFEFEFVPLLSTTGSDFRFFFFLRGVFDGVCERLAGSAGVGAGEGDASREGFAEREFTGAGGLESKVRSITESGTAMRPAVRRE
jgi:hypothetical protein